MSRRSCITEREAELGRPPDKIGFTRGIRNDEEAKVDGYPASSSTPGVPVLYHKYSEARVEGGERVGRALLIVVVVIVVIVLAYMFLSRSRRRP